MPGGRIAPDGRTPQAGGPGKQSKRSDLSKPATPGLSDSSLQQGDVSELEQGQAVAPRAGTQKQVQAPAAGGDRPSKRPAASGGSAGQAPSPLEFMTGRFGGEQFTPGQAPTVNVDPQPWMPLFERMVMSPNASGGLTAAYIQKLSQLRRRPQVPHTNFLDFDEADGALDG